MQLLSLLTKTDVHCVVSQRWMKRLNTRGFQLTIYLIMHGNFLALMVTYSALTFQLTRKAEPLKIRGKNDLQNCRKIEL